MLKQGELGGANEREKQVLYFTFLSLLLLIYGGSLSIIPGAGIQLRGFQD